MKKKSGPEADKFDEVLERMLATPPQFAEAAPKIAKKAPVVDRKKRKA